MKRISILIVDDEAEIADLIEIHLEKEGYHVVKAKTDGEEAVHIIETPNRLSGFRYYDAENGWV